MRVVRALVLAALAVWYFAGVFGVSHGRLPDDGLGDWIDPYFINYLLEHWSHALWTLSNPTSPPMYFPARGTLGYSHGLVLYAPFYIAVRLFLDPFQAYTAALLLVFLCGTACLYLLFRRAFRLEVIESALLTACFVTSPNVITGRTGTWSQTASVLLVPAILLIGFWAFQVRARALAAGLAMLAGCLATLLFVQEYYTGAFVVLLVGLHALCGIGPAARAIRAALIALASGASGRPMGSSPRRPPSVWWLAASAVFLLLAIVVAVSPLEQVTVWGRHVSARDPVRPLIVALLAGGWYTLRRWPVVGWTRIAASRVWQAAGTLPMLWRAASAGAAIGALIFLWIYLPSYLEHRVFPEEQLDRSLVAVDFSQPIASVGQLRALSPYDSLRPIWLVVAVAILAWVPWFRVDRRSRVYGLWCVVIAAVVVLIPLNAGGVSIWKTLFAGLPGFSVIRDPRRIIYVYELAAVLIAGFFLRAATGGRASRIAVVTLLLALLAADWNRRPFNFERDRATFARWVEQPIAVDASCQSFFIQGASADYMSRSGHMWTLYGIDAAFVSLRYAIPTLNGYSAWQPEGWELANPQEPEYSPRVRSWIERHHLTNVCALDIEARTMTPFR